VVTRVHTPAIRSRRNDCTGERNLAPRGGENLAVTSETGLLDLAGRKSRVRKPFAGLARPANDFENRPVQTPIDQQQTGAFYVRKGYFGKRATLSHHRFAVSSDRFLPSSSEVEPSGAGL